MDEALIRVKTPFANDYDVFIYYLKNNLFKKKFNTFNQIIHIIFRKQS